MMSVKELQVLLVSDLLGRDDEGMKKIARMLSKCFQALPGIKARVVSPIEAFRAAPEYNIVHYIGGPTYRSVLFVAGCKLRNKHLRSILTFTNPHWNGFSDYIIRILPPDQVIVLSEYWLGWAKKIGLSATLLPVSGVDLERFAPVSVGHKRFLRQELGLPVNKKIALHVGHLKADRNLVGLLEAQKHPDIQVVIVGSTTTIQSNDLVRLLKSANCIVITGYQSKIESYYKAADCYVFPTMDYKASVQMPLSILEAMAANLPIVTTMFGGLPNFFRDIKGFTYFMSNEFANIGQIIMNATSEHTDTNAIAQSYSWEKSARQLLKLYQNISGG